jgi:excisionase family DNA binding protein
MPLAPAKIEEVREDFQWLTVGEASALLQVSPSTLRRWTDQQLVPVRKTAGGHRRYGRDAIGRLARALGTAGTMGALAHPAAALSPDWGVSHKELEGEGWYSAFARPELLSYMRTLGQRLLGLLVQHVSRSHEDPRFLEEAKEVGVSYGHQSARYKIGLQKTLDAFVFFRNSFTQTAYQVLRIDEASGATEIVRLTRLTDTFMDAVLAGIAEGYELPSGGSLPAGSEHGSRTG